VDLQKSSNFAPAFRGPVPEGVKFNIKYLKTKRQMIIVPVKEGENIEKALKKFKRKFEKTGVVKELRRRQQFDKPSVLKRLKMEHAIYVQQLRTNEE
jgi:small subunit ribosomal protein S21